MYILNLILTVIKVTRVELSPFKVQTICKYWGVMDIFGFISGAVVVVIV
jgi:hypothetical protein